MENNEPVPYVKPRVRINKAMTDVLTERSRQVDAEGYSEDHDDKSIECQLATAAACYAVCETKEQVATFKVLGVRVWPWDFMYWKPTTYRRNLVKAAALLLAEIERLDRREAKGLS